MKFLFTGHVVIVLLTNLLIISGRSARVLGVHHQDRFSSLCAIGLSSIWQPLTAGAPQMPFALQGVSSTCVWVERGDGDLAQHTGVGVTRQA